MVKSVVVVVLGWVRGWCQDLWMTKRPQRWGALLRPSFSVPVLSTLSSSVVFGSLVGSLINR